jgi:hypothetical protein
VLISDRPKPEFLTSDKTEYSDSIADTEYSVSAKYLATFAEYSVSIGHGIEQVPAWLAWGVLLVHKPTT